MLRPTNEWPKTAASAGTLFFAQTLISFLDMNEFEGFRAYTLDTLARINEAIAVAEGISAGLLNEELLKTIARELAWSLKSDAAALALARDECEIVIQQCEKKPNEYHHLLSTLRVLKRRLSPGYRGALAHEIVTRINDPKNRSELLAAIGFLASHLVNDGHDRNFIKNRVRERFLSGQIKRVGAAVVRAFLDGVRDERNDYRIVIGIDDVTASLLQGRPGWTVVERADLLPFVAEALKSSGTTQKYAKFGIRQEHAPDPYRASSMADEELERLRAFMIVPSNAVHVRWSDYSFVHRPRGNRGETLVTVSQSLQKFTKEPQRNKFLSQQNTALFKKMDCAFDDYSNNRIARAIATANAATKTTEDEARLISIWSAFEILSSDPTETKIVHICRELVPCICLKYHRRVFASVYGQLSIAYKGPFRKLILKTVGGGEGGSYTRFAKFVLMQEFEADRTALLNMVSDNPAALHRLYRLQKLYSAPAAFRRSVTDHAERVGWQLRRIYRVRNSLVHAGEAPNHLEGLMMNGLDYFRSCMMNIILVASKEADRSSLDGTIAEIGLDWELMQKRVAAARGVSFDRKMVGELFESV